MRTSDIPSRSSTLEILEPFLVKLAKITNSGAIFLWHCSDKTINHGFRDFT
jgi:hypothetical protein